MRLLYHNLTLLFFLLLLPQVIFAQVIMEPIQPIDSFYADNIEKVSMDLILKVTLIAAISIAIHFFIFSRFIGSYKKVKVLNSIFLHQAMRSKPITIGPQDSLTEALARLRINKIEYLIVSSELRTLEGVISIKEINKAMDRGSGAIHEESILNQEYVKDYMLTEVPTIPSYSTLNKAINLIKKTGFVVIPIVDETNRVVGTLTQSDIVMAISKYITGR